MVVEPVHQIRADGTAVRIGEWVHAERRLVLERNGFPLLGPGDHRLESELPWVFWDMCPSGYLARQFLRSAGDLGLPREPRLWSAADCLAALCQYGFDLSGNLIVGEASLARFHGWLRARRQPVVRAPGPPPSDSMARYLADLDAGFENAVTPEAQSPSSLGGERPKFVIWAHDGVDLLVKFSPPRATELGQRWWDLLHMEALCASVLRDAGIPAVDSRPEQHSDRAVLVIPRFDRLSGFGRRGATTLYWYAGGDPEARAPSVVGQLVRDGHLSAPAARTVTVVHEFSRAIGNNDAHLGNYGLQFDDEGRASLAPFYDILPMMLAPRADELPDGRLAPVTPTVDAQVKPLVDALVQRATAPSPISQPFLERWLKLIGR